MSFNFDELLQEGKGAAENVLKNKREMQKVLDDLKKSLSQFLEIPIKFEEYTGYVENNNHPFKGIAAALQPKEKSGYNEVYIESEDVEVSKLIFELKRSDDVYPITIVRGRSHSVADDQNEFASAIGQIVSNSQFHLQLNSFKREVEEKLLEKLFEKPQDVPKSE